MNDRPHVCVDPAMRFGRPNVRGVSVDILGDAVLGGDSVDMVADEYQMRREDVLVACWYLGLYGQRLYRRLWRHWAERAGALMWNTREVDYGSVPDPPRAPS